MTLGAHQITAVRIRNLLTRLDNDLGRVPAGDLTRPAIASLVARAKLALRAIEVNLTDRDLASHLWIHLFAPKLKQLRPMLTTALNAQVPPLTAANVRKLIARLNVDLKRVPQGDANLQQITLDVNQLIPILQTVAADLDAGAQPVPDWTDIIAPQFDRLTALFTQSLQLNPATDTGACLYEVNGVVDCIVCTSTQCLDLGGAYEAGQPCP